MVVARPERAFSVNGSAKVIERPAMEKWAPRISGNGTAKTPPATEADSGFGTVIGSALIGFIIGVMLLPYIVVPVFLVLVGVAATLAGATNVIRRLSLPAIMLRGPLYAPELVEGATATEAEEEKGAPAPEVRHREANNVVNRNARGWIWPFAAGLALAGPAIVVGALVPSSTFLGLGIVFLTVMAAASSTMFISSRWTEVGEAKMRSVAELIEELEVVDTLPAAPVAPMAVGVSRVGGKCVLDFHEGDLWRIGANGGLSRPLCEPAAAALCAAMAEHPEAAEVQFTCHCPIAEADVVEFVGHAES